MSDLNNNIFAVKQINIPHEEWKIYNNCVSTDKNKLIEMVKDDLEREVLLEPVKIKEVDGWLMINDSLEKWLKVFELHVI